ncbi:MAG TPA: hypothetical protein VMJ11_18300 [Paraburkholderia sp.]|uniref:hypothetical protein n=1 Tax=Paraburkholderia sp. TaxID=1926495 RepID=UPI002C1173EA|nr:hypothetical protein [Paraburkholderia sp.]HTR08563.1 hypothetical protein [Paraburkholderia sp.]
MSETWMGLVIGCSALAIALPAVVAHYRRERHRARLLRHLNHHEWCNWLRVSLERKRDVKKRCSVGARERFEGCEKGDK